MNKSTFFDYIDLTDGEIELVITDKLPAQPDKGYVSQYGFNICLAGKTDPIGSIRLRLGIPSLRYSMQGISGTIYMKNIEATDMRQKHVCLLRE